MPISAQKKAYIKDHEEEKAKDIQRAEQGQEYYTPDLVRKKYAQGLATHRYCPTLVSHIS